MSKKEIFNNAVTNIDDEYIEEAIKAGVKKRGALSALIAVAVIAAIVAAVDLHRQRAEQKQAQKEAERIEYLKEREKNKNKNPEISESQLTNIKNANTQLDEYVKVSKIALENMKNPKEVILNKGKSKIYKQFENVSLSDIDLSNIDCITVTDVKSKQITSITDINTINRICEAIKLVKGSSPKDPSLYTAPEYKFVMRSKGEFVFSFTSNFDGRFQCSSFIYCVNNDNLVDYTVYDYVSIDICQEIIDIIK